MALDGLYVPVKAPWYAAFRDELLGGFQAKFEGAVFQNPTNPRLW
jgi:hypothetical protein